MNEHRRKPPCVIVEESDLDRILRKRREDPHSRTAGALDTGMRPIYAMEAAQAKAVGPINQAIDDVLNDRPNATAMEILDQLTTENQVSVSDGWIHYSSGGKPCKARFTGWNQRVSRRRKKLPR